MNTTMSSTLAPSGFSTGHRATALPPHTVFPSRQSFFSLVRAAGHSVHMRTTAGRAWSVGVVGWVGTIRATEITHNSPVPNGNTPNELGNSHSEY